MTKLDTKAAVSYPAVRKNSGTVRSPSGNLKPIESSPCRQGSYPVSIVAIDGVVSPCGA